MKEEIADRLPTAENELFMDLLSDLNTVQNEIERRRGIFGFYYQSDSHIPIATPIAEDVEQQRTGSVFVDIEGLSNCELDRYLRVSSYRIKREVKERTSYCAEVLDLMYERHSLLLNEKK